MINQRKRNLILLPGLDGTGILFDDLVDQLKEEFLIARISYPSSTLYSLDDLAAFVMKEMMDPQNSIILAESFSGLVALTLLEKLSVHPKGIIFGMCFVDPPFRVLLRLISKLPFKQIPWEYIPDIMYRRFCLGSSATREQIKDLQQVLSKINPRVIFHRLGLMKNFRIPHKIKIFDIPCTYIQAINDHLISNKAAAWFSQSFQPFFLKRISGSHFLFQSQAEYCAACIINFDLYLETAEKCPIE